MQDNLMREKPPRLAVEMDPATSKRLVRLRYILEEQSGGIRISVSEVVRRAIRELAASYNIQ